MGRSEFLLWPSSTHTHTHKLARSSARTLSVLLALHLNTGPGVKRISRRGGEGKGGGG